MIARNFQAQRDSSLLRKLFFLSAIIIAANFLIGIFARVTTATEDEIAYLDALWRVVVGQRVGIDFHFRTRNSVHINLAHCCGTGSDRIGMSCGSALLYSTYQLPFVAASLPNARLLVEQNLAVLFCVTLAFQVSAPTFSLPPPPRWG